MIKNVLYENIKIPTTERLRVPGDEVELAPPLRLVRVVAHVPTAPAREAVPTEERVVIRAHERGKLTHGRDALDEVFVSPAVVAE